MNIARPRASTGHVHAGGPRRRRRAAGIPAEYSLAILLLTALFAALTLGVCQGRTRALDLAFMRLLARHVGPDMGAFLERGAQLGVLLILLAPCLALGLLGRRSTGALFLVIASELGAAVANALVKVATRRPAPGMDLPQPIAAGEPFARLLAPFGSWYSFPSGHTVGAVVSFGLLAYVASRRRPRAARVLAGLLAVAGVATMALARVALARHYPSDVLGGLLGGGAWLLGTVGLLRRAPSAR